MRKKLITTLIILLLTGCNSNTNSSLSITEKDSYGNSNDLIDSINTISSEVPSAPIESDDDFLSTFIASKYTHISEFRYGHATAQRDGKSTIIDENGNELLPLIYDFAEDYNGSIGVFNYYDEPDPDVPFPYFGYYGIVDYSGNTILPMEYEYMFYSHEEQVGVAYKGYNAGVFNSNGEFTIPMIYENIQRPDYWEASQHIILATKEGKLGYISPQNEVVIDFEYEGAQYFNNGHAMVYPEYRVYFELLGGEKTPVFVIYKYQVIDTEGNALYSSPYLKESYDAAMSISPFDSPMTFLYNSDKYLSYLNGESYIVFSPTEEDSEVIIPSDYRVECGFVPWMSMVGLPEREVALNDSAPLTVYNIDANTPYTLIPLP